jgi:acyl carrier protein
MTQDDILAKVTALARGILSEPGLQLTMASTADVSEKWDSVAHMRLVLAVEEAFGVHFATSQIESFASVGNLVSAIATQLGKA